MPAVDPIAAIRHRLTQQKSSIELYLATGGAKSYEEYSRMVGEYSSLQKIESDLDEIERRYIES
ncbi:MAG: hypothetical protein QM805_07615 [Pseudomonas sp.]